MANIKGLHHVGLPTACIEKSVAFYEKLGGEICFEKMDEFEGEPIRVVLMSFYGTVIEMYERKETAMVSGAWEHLAFQVDNLEELYEMAKKEGLDLMEDCKDEIQYSSYWPNGAHWFIVYGMNGEKIEFCK